ncbi:MAG: hypothetical protein HZA15_09165 [Nitrospirae bacterium]|nr:hypothetical protein [Nitrospirota bacterium]
MKINHTLLTLFLCMILLGACQKKEEVQKPASAISVKAASTKEEPEYAKSFVITVIDINENKEYGRFHNIYKQDKPAFCQVAERPCRDMIEWEALIKPFMEE